MRLVRVGAAETGQAVPDEPILSTGSPDTFTELGIQVLGTQRQHVLAPR